MVPFYRRVEVGQRVIDAMAANGLTRGDNGLEFYEMCEIPNNVIQIDAFARLFDGFSIGSNDLTQLTLGADRDSEIVAFDFDEAIPACWRCFASQSPSPSGTAGMLGFAARRLPITSKSCGS